MKGYFFNAQPTEDIVNHPSGYDRTYDAVDFNRYMGSFFTNGVFVQADADACKITSNGLKLAVHPGVLNVNGGQCHFEAGDGITLDGPGKYSIFCRLDNSVDVRAFRLLAVKGDIFPTPTRSGDIYDMCLAHATATASGATLEDTRGALGLCGYAALTGQPPYYPPDSTALPYILWLYTIGFPMDAAQKAAVEGNPSLMAIYSGKGFHSKEESLRAATKTLYGLGTSAVPDSVFVKIKSLFDGSLKIEAGSYIGTGSGSNSLTCAGFVPMLLIVSPGDATVTPLIVANGDTGSQRTYSNGSMEPADDTILWNGRTITWYTQSNIVSLSTKAAIQLNGAGQKYKYYFIGV